MTTEEEVKEEKPKKVIFVFGSNLAGLHGAGAARYAEKHHGARKGRGHGLHGDSYALPTKDTILRTLPLMAVERYIREFILFATNSPDLEFKITQVGCGLAGFTADEIAPCFKGAPENCTFDTKWKKYLGKEKRYWGSYNVI
jgi:hypothetical protein